MNNVLIKIILLVIISTSIFPNIDFNNCKKIEKLEIALLDGTLITEDSLQDFLFWNKDKIMEKFGESTYLYDKYNHSVVLDYKKKGISFCLQDELNIIQFVQFDKNVKINGMKVLSDIKDIEKKLGKVKYNYLPEEDYLFEIGYKINDLKLIFSNDFIENEDYNKFNLKIFLNKEPRYNLSKPKIILKNKDLIYIFKNGKKELERKFGKAEYEVEEEYKNEYIFAYLPYKKIFSISLSDKVEIDGVKAGMNLKEINKIMKEKNIENMSKEKNQLIYSINGIEYWFYSIYDSGNLSSFIVRKLSNLN